MSRTTPSILVEHLTAWLGQWPPAGAGLSVVGSDVRSVPGWDGHVHDVIGVTMPTGGVLSVAPERVDAVARLVGGRDITADLAAIAVAGALGEAVGRVGRVGLGAFRWSTTPTPTPDTGEWVPTDDPRVPEWLWPFNGDVLIGWDEEGRYGAGVGRKQHDGFGHELSVGTEPVLQGRGIARALVTTAARRILDDGAVPTYLHAHSNVASAHVAEASGFPDEGWQVIGLW